MTFIIQNFGPNLARLRIEKGVSQTQLAEDLGIGKQSISDYEKQKSYPTFANLDKIAEYFNATPTQLFGTSKAVSYTHLDVYKRQLQHQLVPKEHSFYQILRVHQ